VEMENDDVQRVLGKLEEGFRATTETQKQLAENQKVLSQALSKFSDRMIETQTKHNAEDAKFQSDILAKMRGIEILSDTVESHGEALVDLEKRVDTQEENEQIRHKIRGRDLKWLKVIVILVFILVGDKFTGSKLSEWVSVLFK
jgi:hypothetical protein